MPLRVRLIALIGLVLLVSLACGSVLVGWHAANSVRTELRAALDVGAKTIRNGIDELVRSGDRANELRHLVARSTATAMCARRCWMRGISRSPYPRCSFRRSRFPAGSAA